MLDIIAWVIISAKNTAGEVHVKELARFTPVEIMSGSKKTLKDAKNAIRVVHVSPSDSTDPESVVHSRTDDVFEKDGLWDLRDLTKKRNWAFHFVARLIFTLDPWITGFVGLSVRAIIN